MTRLMSVAYTEEQVRARVKDVTRRLGWWEDKHGRRLLAPGERLTLCRKVMGRKAGEPLVRIVDVEVLDVRRERLDLMVLDPEYGAVEVAREGFPGMGPVEFIQRYFTEAQGVPRDAEVTRVEWRYLDPAPVPLADVDDVPLIGLDMLPPGSADVVAAVDATLSPDRRRTARQQAQVRAGRHPLTGGPLHPDASRDRDRDSGTRDPLTCGSCVHRVMVGHHSQAYPKCVVDRPFEASRSVAHSAASDVRAWWPACPGYTPTPQLEEVTR